MRIDGNHIINGGYSDGRVGLFSKGVSFVDGKSGIDNLWVSNRAPVKIYRFESLYLLIDESRESYIYFTNIEKIRSYIEGYSNSDEMDDYRLDSYDIQDVDSFSELAILSKNISYLPLATDQLKSDLVFKVDENESKELSVHIFLAESEALADFRFKWFKNGVKISGETESTYKLGIGDQGASFHVQVLYSAEDSLDYTFNSASITTLEPTYSITSGSDSYDEGQSALFSLVTTNLVAGTAVAYTLSGISESDLESGSLTGTAEVGESGTTVISIPLAADTLTEGAETLTITLDEFADKTASVIINDTSKNPGTVNTTHLTSILVDEDVLGASPVILGGLTENIEKTDGVTTNYVFSFNGSDYDYDDISPFIIIVLRDNEFTDDFRSELADFAPEYKNLTYQEAVDAVGLVGISAAIITVAGADGNYIG